MEREDIQILLVEDSRTHEVFIIEAFKRSQYPAELHVARTLAEARAYLDKTTPDLAIIDLYLPDGNGAELLKEQNTNPAYPIIIVSGQGDEHVAVGAMKAGALDYVVKTPAALTEITRVVERALREWSHIVERKQTEEELQAFAHTVSHDLRNPLTTILGYTELLLDFPRKELDEQSREFVSEIRTVGERMATLIDDLLAMATAGNIEAHAEILDIGTVVDEVVFGLSGRINELEAKVNVKMMPRVVAAKTLLMQILDNLLSNALKYGCNKGGQIGIGGERKEDKVRFYVRDHGPGIPENERDRIFDAFYRRAADKNKSGSGIGLTTVQRIVKRLKAGRIWLEETPGGGCTFWVEFEDEPQTT